MAIRNGIFKVRNASTGEKDEVMLKTTIAQVDDLNKLTGATASAAGVWGLAPAPPKGSQNLPLCGDAKYKVLPVEGGGTGANTVAAAVKALFGSSAVGSSTKSIYYDGATLKACADSIGGGGIVAQLLEQNGYVKFANGLILQWGAISVNANLTKHSFVIPFDKKCYYCGGLPWKMASAGYCCVASTITKTEFDVYYYRAGSAVSACYIALGI